MLGVFGAVQGVQGALRWRELHSGTTAPPVYSLATPRPAIKLSIWRARTKDRRFMAAVLKRALRQCYWFYKRVCVIGWRRDWINLPKKEKKILVCLFKMKPYNRSREWGVMPSIRESLRKNVLVLAIGRFNKQLLCDIFIQQCGSLVSKPTLKQS